jgi:hypothetical protein
MLHCALKHWSGDTRNIYGKRPNNIFKHASVKGDIITKRFMHSANLLNPSIYTRPWGLLSL